MTHGFKNRFNLPARSASIAAALALAAPLLVGGCPPGPETTTTETDSNTDSDSDVSSSETTMGGPNTTATTDEPTTDPTTEEPTTSPVTTEPPPECGDGNQDPDEECDDGPDNSDDGACTEDCKAASCGDGLVYADVEACDEGASNDDDLYGGCTTRCELGPRCGDGVVQEDNETCDEPGDLAGGCLSTCVQAKSCLEIINDDPNAASGAYVIHPEGVEDDVVVYCDMEADGGGYTFLKVDVQGVQNRASANDAENFCYTYGLHLMIPRSPAHVAAAFAVAMDEAVTPVGGGGVLASDGFLRIFKIFPTNVGQSCVGAPLNDVDCPEWFAGDQIDASPYWVTSDPSPDPGQPSVNNCTGCSMEYLWNPDGTIKFYSVVFGDGEGAASYRWMCVAEDKISG